MKHYYLLAVLFTIFFCDISFSQLKTLKYIDENFTEISKIEFERKNNSSVYITKTYYLDTVTYKSVFLRYYMGKLAQGKKNQLFRILSQRNRLDTTKALLIHYKDSLKSKKTFPSRDSIAYLKNGVHKHISSHKTFVRQHKNCEKDNSRKQITMYHFYNHNDGHPDVIKKMVWHKDHLSLLRKLFYNPSLNNKYWTILIHPNGDYVVNYFGVRPSKKWRDFKKHKNWNTYFKDFKKSMALLNP